MGRIGANSSEASDEMSDILALIAKNTENQRTPVTVCWLNVCAQLCQFKQVKVLEF